MFLTKPRVKTELEFLSALERGEVVTQMTLSRRIGVAVGLVNALLKRATMKGFVKARSAPYKRYAYYLTPKGFSEKSRLVAEYLEVSLEFFRDARRQYQELFWRAEKVGCRRLVLIGGGELAEIAIMSSRDLDVEVLAIVDTETNRAKLFGVPVVRALSDVAGCDAVIVTDSRQPQAVYDELCRTLAADRIFAPELLKITRETAHSAADGGEPVA
jgi:DNA-binding MarR family transcriptional regulator